MESCCGCIHTASKRNSCAEHDVLAGLNDASPAVVQTHARELTLHLEGEAKRLCQQCSTFHPLADFDGSKR
jgi:SBP domain